MFRRYLQLAITLACGTAALSPAPASAQWGWVEIDSQLANTNRFYRNVDTMILPDGTPVVGYTRFSQNAYYPTLGFVEDDFARTVVSDTPGSIARFEADRFGIISYVSRNGSSLAFGSDLGSRQTLTGDFLDQELEAGLPDLALDQGGIPALVALQQGSASGQYLITEFDVPSAIWMTRTVPPAFNTGSSNASSAAYTDDGRLVIATSTNGGFQLLIEQPDGLTFGFADDTSIVYLFNHALTTRDNQIAFAYSRFAGGSTTIGVYDGISFSFNDINTPTPIAPGSLAFAPDGTLWFSHIDGDTGEVLLTEQTGPDSWSTQSLGTTGILASLAFDENGTPYVGVAQDTRVRLYSTAFNIPGDLNGDGMVDQQDLNLILLNFGSTAVGSDANGDGVTDYHDLTVTLRNWTADTAPDLTVPEPGTGAVLLLLITVGLMRRLHGAGKAGGKCI